MTFFVIGFLINLIVMTFFVTSAGALDSPLMTLVWIMLFVNQGFNLVLWSKSILGTLLERQVDALHQEMSRAIERTSTN